MDRQKELIKIIKDAQEELSEINTAISIEENKKLIGNCYRYRNCYSVPKPNEYWYLYKKIIRVDENGSLYSFEFETDYLGNISIHPNEYGYIGDAKKITREEFDKAWKTLMSHLSVIA